MGKQQTKFYLLFNEGRVQKESAPQGPLFFFSNNK